MTADNIDGQYVVMHNCSFEELWLTTKGFDIWENLHLLDGSSCKDSYS